MIVAREDDFANIGIDPRLFRAFDVAAVPTYVAVSSDFDLCAGFACRTQVPAHDRMVGNVTLEYALTTFAEANGTGARVAAVGLKRLHPPAARSGGAPLSFFWPRWPPRCPRLPPTQTTK